MNVYNIYTILTIVYVDISVYNKNRRWCCLKNSLDIKTTANRINSENTYLRNLREHFSNLPLISNNLLASAKTNFYYIEEKLYTCVALIDILEKTIPQKSLQAILSPEQKRKLTKGSLELMTKKDGSLMATLINPKTKKMVAQIPLEEVSLTAELSQSLVNYTMQMQMAEFSEQIKMIQVAVEDIRLGQEYDRLASAYSCQQKLLQALAIQNIELKKAALLQLAYDCEDSRNLLMQSQQANLSFIKNEPENYILKIIKGAKNEKIETRINEIRESLNSINLVSLTQAIAYQELGEFNSLRVALNYYSDYIEKAYFVDDGLIERLDSIDPSPENYWTNALPKIKKIIRTLPDNSTPDLLKGDYLYGE